MKKEDILEIIDKIESLKTIDNIEISSDGITIKADKISQRKPIFSKNKETAGDPSIATPGQVKYAKDLMQKVFGENEESGLDFLAHTLEVPLSEVQDTDAWDGNLTKEMAGTIIDKLDSMHRIKKGG